MTVVVSLGTLLGEEHGVGEVPGYGFISGDHARQLATARGSVWRRIVTDPVTGAALDVTTHRYRPTPAMAQTVAALDAICRAPGCTTSAHRCDVDHDRPWPAGPTRISNLSAKHRRHHNHKTRGTWTRDHRPRRHHPCGEPCPAAPTSPAATTTTTPSPDPSPTPSSTTPPPSPPPAPSTTHRLLSGPDGDHLPRRMDGERTWGVPVRREFARPWTEVWSSRTCRGVRPCCPSTVSRCIPAPSLCRRGPPSSGACRCGRPRGPRRCAR